ncbi:MAG: GAF domain-containing protein [SAR324 cluster bacterium]|nr:GAF domain-containing protein [SAR324 cluster bacterium]
MQSLIHTKLIFPHTIPLLLSLLTSLFLASLTIQSGSTQRKNQLFTLYCLLQATDYLNGILQILLVSKEAALLCSRLEALVYVFIIPIGMHFVHQFLDIRKRQGLVRGIYLIITLLVPFGLTRYHIMDKTREGNVWVSHMGLNYQLLTFIALGVTLYSMGLLISGLWHCQKPEKRQEILFIFAGLLLNGILSLLSALLHALGIERLYLQNYGFLPLGLMAYGLLRHQFLDTSGSWLAQSRIPTMLSLIVWAPFGVFLLFWILSPEGTFYPLFKEHIGGYALPPLLTMLFSLALGSLMIRLGGNQKKKQLFTFYCLIHAVGYFNAVTNLVVSSRETALILARWSALIYVLIIPVTIHFVHRVLAIKHRQWLERGLYGLTLLVVPFTQTRYHITDKFYTPYGWQSQTGGLYQFLTFLALGCILYSIILLARGLKQQHPPETQREILFVLSGFLLNVVLSFLDSLFPVIGVVIYPVGNFGFLPLGFMAYGIFRHDLLHLNVYTQRRIINTLLQGLFPLAYGMAIVLGFWILRPYSLEHILQRLIPYGIPPLLSFLSCFFLSMALIYLAEHKKESWVFNGICLLYGFLNLDILLNGLITDPALGLQISRWDHFFFVFIFGLNLHFLFLVTGEQRHRWLIKLSYGISLLMAPLTQTSWYLQDMYSYSWGFFAQKAPLFDLMSGLWMAEFFYMCAVFYQSWSHSQNTFEKHRAFYLMVGFGVTATLNLGNIPTLNGMEWYPPGNFTFIPILLFAYGVLVHNGKELLRMLRNLFYWTGLAGFIIVLVMLMWELPFFRDSPLGTLVGFTGVMLALKLFSLSWTLLLNMFFPQEKENLQQVLKVLMAMLSQATRFRELYQFVSYTLFKHFSTRQCSLLIQTNLDSSFSGWSYQSFQASFFSGADPLNNSEHPVILSSKHPLLSRLSELKRAMNQEEVAEWILIQQFRLEPEDLLSHAEWILPIFQEDALKGLLLVSEKTDSSAYSVAEQEFLHQLGLALGPHIQNLELLQGLEAKVQERTASLHEAMEEIQHINQVVQAVNTTLDLDEIVQTIMDALQEIFEFDQIGIFLLDAQKKELRMHHYYVEGVTEQHFRNAQEMIFPLKDYCSYVSNVCMTQEFAYISPITPEVVDKFMPLDRRFYDNIPVKAYLLCPLLVQNQAIGTVVIAHSRKPFHLTEEEILKIQHYVTQIATAINNARLVEESRQAHRHLSQVHEISQKVSVHLDIQEITRVFIQEIVQAIRPEGSGAIMLYHTENNTLRLYANYGLDSRYSQTYALPVTPETMYTYDCFHHQKTAIFERETLARYQTTELALKLHFQRHLIQQMVVPLTIEQESFGLVIVSHYDPEQGFTESDRQLLENLALNLAHHFQNARIHQKIQLKEREITHINQVVQTVNKTLNLDEVMQAAMEAMREIFWFDQIGILLIDPEKQALRLQKLYGNVDQNIVSRLRQLMFSLENINSFYVKTVVYNALNYIPQITPDLVKQFCESDYKAYQMNPVSAILMYPLEVQGKVMGMIGFSNLEGSFALSEEQIYQIQRYVTQIATSINNARLHEELKTTRMQLAESEKVAAMTRTFEKFVPQQFLRRLARDGIDQMQLGKAETDVITVLFSDIRSFTNLSESMSPQELLNFLNAYLKRMNAPIHAHHGFVDKFIGDAIMALFDSQESTDAEDAQNAVQAAIAMQEAVKVYNGHRRNSGYRPIAIGIGIHSGPVIFGTVGSEDRLSSTVLGDNVNLASRLEGLTKKYHAPIIISSHTWRLLHPHQDLLWRELDFVKVKGKSQPESIFEIFNADEEPVRSQKQSLLQPYHQGLMNFHIRQFQEALGYFETCLGIYPEDVVSQMYCKRCQEFLKNPPSAEWDGSLQLDQK